MNTHYKAGISTILASCYFELCWAIPAVFLWTIVTIVIVGTLASFGAVYYLFYEIWDRS